jgi:hypothetical protein
MPKKRRCRPKPGAELSIEQLGAITRYCGYQLVHFPASADLYDCRTGNIEARGDRALDHLRSLYVERDVGVLANIPEFRVGESGQ